VEAMKKGSNKVRECTEETDGAVEAKAAGASHPEWQEFVDGYLRCKPCNKAVDEHHLSTDAHKTKLERWKQVMSVESGSVPELPYLAWVPYEGTRALMCLLCRKSGRPQGTWVADENAHCGTHENPAGSKEHRKNLMNYPPGDEWYEENVTRARLRYHPVARSSEEQREPSPEPTRNKAPVQLATPVPTSSDEKDEKSLRKKNKLGSYKMEEVEETKTERVSSEVFPTEEKEPTTEAASKWLSANDVTQNATLPPGWASAQDSEGNTYYYHRKDRVPQWEFPEWPESESVGA